MCGLGPAQMNLGLAQTQVRLRLAQAPAFNRGPGDGDCLNLAPGPISDPITGLFLGYSSGSHTEAFQIFACHLHR